MSVPSDKDLSMGDVALSDHRWVNLFVGRTGLDLCLVAALLGYLSVRGLQVP